MRAVRIILFLLLLPLGGSLSAQAQEPSAAYILLPESQRAEGCIDPPCDCPVTRGPLKGSFRLVSTGAVEGYLTYDVLDVSFDADGFTEFQTKGSGTYRIFTEGAPLQELVLDLETAPGVETRFESGLVPAEVFPPELRITVSYRNSCWGQDLSIHASPIDRPTTWGTIKSLYAED